MRQPELITEQQLALELGAIEPPLISQLWTVEQIYEHANTRLFRSFKEDRRIERKSANTASRTLGDYFSMWANTPPEGGLLAVGIENDGTISGCRRCSAEIINDIEDCPRIYCPDARFESKRVPVDNDSGSSDFVILFRVNYRKDKVVRTNTHKVFRRSGSNKQELMDDEIRELQIEKGELQFELEPINLKFPNDFDENLIRTFCQSVVKKKSLELVHSPEEILVQQKLGSWYGREFVANNACCLLFAKDPKSQFPGCKIRFMRFEGEFEGTGSDYNLVKDIMIEGPIPTLIIEAEKVVSGQLREYSALGDDGRFYVVPEYPKTAWYEAIVNACAHRSYGLRNMNIFIKMFDDKLVIQSPGPLPPLVTPENIFEMHNPRNPFTMEALRYFDFVKCANEGTRRMRDAMMQSSLPAPRFEQSRSTSGNVVVTLQNNHKQRKKFIDSNAANTIVSAALFKTLSDEDRRIINYVVEYATIKVSQAAKLLDRDWGTAKKMLEKLVTKELLIRKHRKDITRDPKAEYMLNPKLRDKTQ